MARPGDPTFGWDDDAPSSARNWPAESSFEAPESDAPVPAEPAVSQSPREVAVDAPGASKTYTYEVPGRLSGIQDGEAVLVEFGRGRQALGVVLGPARETAPGAVRPILARVRADGPLLPRLTLDFARWISEEYLAPPAATLRSMLPPGMLERLDLVAERSGSSGGPAARPADGEESALLDRLAAGPRPVRDLEGPDGRAATLRRLRSLASRGSVRLEWTLTAASAGPRFERWLRMTDAGRAELASRKQSWLRFAAGINGVLGSNQSGLAETT